MLRFPDLNTLQVLLTGISAIILAITILIQNTLTQREWKIAYLPSLVPRYSNPDEHYISYLLISNVGQGSAVDVKLTITDLENNKSDPFSRYAIQPKEERTTSIPLRDKSNWRITGTYLDTAGKKHNVEIEFEYPPKITKFKQ